MAVNPCFQYLPKKYQKLLAELTPLEQNEFVQDLMNKGDKVEKVVRHARVKAKFMQYLEETPDRAFEETANSLMAGKGALTNRGMGSLYGHIETAQNQMDLKINELLEAHRPKMFGLLRDPRGQRNLIREIFGKMTGDRTAHLIAKQWKQVTKYIMEEFNKAGGGIVKLEDFALPTMHDARAIANAKFDSWYDLTKDLIRKDRFARTMGVEGKMSDKQFYQAMRKVYDELSTDGIIKSDEVSTNFRAKGRIADYHADHRVLHFKDGDAWLKYNDAFGIGEPLGVMNAYTEMMARQVGAMRYLGPHPDMMIKEITTFMGERGYDPRHLIHTYDNIMGRVYGKRNTLGEVMSGVRHLSVGLHIGTALLASQSDLAFSGMTARIRGLNVGRMYKRVFSTMANSKNTRELAVRMMMGAEYAKDQARTVFRFSDVQGARGASKFSNFMIRGSGIHHWTTSLRNTFRVEYGLYVAENANKNIHQIPKPLRRFMDQHGIGRKEWDILRHSPMAEHNGVKFLDWSGLEDPEAVSALSKLVGGIVDETHMAVPEPNPRVKAMMNQGLQTGTPAGEMIRTAGLFKSFAMSTMVGTLARAQSMAPKERAVYLGGLIVGTTILGAVSVQASQLVRGNDGYNWNDPTLWGRGMIQGGIIGLLGEFLFSDDNYGAWGSLIGGPAIGDLETVVTRVMVGSAKEVAALEDNFIREAAIKGINAGRNMVPGRLWYTRLVIDRGIDIFLDHLDHRKFNHKQKSIRNRMKKQEKRGRWWEPGDIKPERAPDIAGVEF